MCAVFVRSKYLLFSKNTHISVKVKLLVKKGLFFHRAINVYTGQSVTRPTLQTLNVYTGQSPKRPTLQTLNVYKGQLPTRSHTTGT